MGLPRKMRTLLLVCGFVCMGVLGCGGVASAQSRASKLPNLRRPATEAKSAERADVTRFRQRVDTALSASGPDKGFWGVLVTDAARGRFCYAGIAGIFFFPAWDEKLFPAALALATLGPGYRIRTTISANGALDANGVLSGDLILNGRGDANLSNRKFPYEKKIERDGPSEKALAALADAVVARGVKEIDGGVIADDSLFQQERFPSGWTVDDMLWSYGAAVSPIAVNDNTFTLELRPGGLAGARHFGDRTLWSADRLPETVLAERMGEPLAEEIRHVNKNSLNLHAELLLLLAAHEKSGAVSREDAVKFAAEFCRTAGIADGDIVLSDGSGLSRRDLVTPRRIVQLLNYDAAH